MPLFNESLESIAQAVVTVKRALKAGVIEKGEYKGLNDYLAKRAKDFKVKKSHLAQANKDLDEELLDEELEFYTEEGDALYKMAEELLEEHEKDDVKAAVEDDWDKQAAACAAWMKMDDKERAAMAALASAWQKSR
jgi:ribonucleotide reductase alpha subunit